MELTVYKIDGSATAKTVTLNDKIFNVEPNDHAIWLDVKQYLANQRQGTHNTLERSTVSGSTRKLKRQKGTGGARAGSIKSPTIRGGATVFGPHPRDYGFKLNKKVKRLARFSAFTYKQQEGCITVVEDFTFSEPKTKEYKAMLKNLKLEGKKPFCCSPRTTETSIFPAATSSAPTSCAPSRPIRIMCLTPTTSSSAKAASRSWTRC